MAVSEVTDSRLRRWRKTGKVDLHGVGTGGGGGGGAVVGGMGEVEARMSLSDVKLVADMTRYAVFV